jgi:hypothetical protein
MSEKPILVIIIPVNNNATGYYRSGSRTGCGTFSFPGIGCPDIIIEIVE